MIVRRKLGTVLMLLGLLSIAAAISLLLYGRREAAAAEKASAQILPQLIAQIANSSAAAEPEAVPVDVTVAEPELYTVTIDDQDYIGYVIIPALNLELPVMADWSYPQLKTAPCRFSGTLEGNDLVVMAHNYARHFGSLQSLVEGDSVYFRDVSGDTVEYQVAKVEILKPTAVEEMTAGEYDLTLFTCTYGGQSRVAVRCDRS